MSYQDDDAEIEASRAPLLDHLVELRSRLIVCVLAMAVGFAICFGFSKQIYMFLLHPFAIAAQLLAAEQAGIALPNSCRNGSCRTCLCRLVQGDIRWRIDWPGLSPDEKREGWILPCVASACSDLVLESTPVRWDQA